MSNELVTVSFDDYPVLSGDSSFADVMAANLAGEELTEFDLPRIKIPKGSTTWIVPTVEGEEVTKEIAGIPLHVTRRRSYWENPIPTGIPPDCSSSDCLTGVGTPGGQCGTFNSPICSLAAPGSAIGPDGKPRKGAACQEKKFFFLLRPGKTLPEVLGIPPTSLKIMRQWVARLPRPLPSYVLGFQLESKGDEYDTSIVKPRVVSELSEDQMQQAIDYAKGLTKVFESVQVDPEVYEPQEV